jgi:hypothetical protein
VSTQWVLRGDTLAPLIGPGYTDEQVRDTMSATLVAGSNVTITPDDAGDTITIQAATTGAESTSASAVNVTVPPNSSVAFPVGTVIELCQYGAGQITIVAGAGVTLRTASSLTTRVQYSGASLRKRATNEWVVGGDLT